MLQSFGNETRLLSLTVTVTQKLTGWSRHIPNMVRTVQLARSITALDLRRMATAANMRLDAQATKQVLEALKKP